MVRLKHRYLLVDILYPDPSTWPAPGPQGKSSSPATPHLQIHSPTSDALTPSLLAKLVRDEVSALFGDWGIGRLGGVNAGGISVKYLSPATSTAIIRCPRASFRLVWTALACMARVPELGAAGGKRGGGGAPPALTRGCVFRVVRVSGTMRKAEEEAIRRARREIVRLQGAEEVGVLEGIVGDLEGEDARSEVADVDVDVEMESDGDH